MTRNRRSRHCAPRLQKGFPLRDLEAEPEFAPLRLAPDYQAMIKEFSQKSR
jgi:hypothetical protein